MVLETTCASMWNDASTSRRNGDGTTFTSTQLCITRRAIAERRR